MGDSTCPLPPRSVFFPSTLGPFACYTGGDIVCDTIRRTQKWEMEVLDALYPYMTPNTTFVDIGSNVGWYSLAAARTNRVESFEPFSSNLLLQNASFCKHPSLSSRIVLHPFGLSDKERRCDLYQIPSINFGDTHAACDPEQIRRLRENGYMKLGESNMRRLDDVASSSLLNAEKVVKIDIEGHEYEMLLGAKKFFCTKERPNAVYVEVFQLGEKLPLLTSFFRKCGYTLSSPKTAPNHLYVRKGVRMALHRRTGSKHGRVFHGTL